MLARLVSQTILLVLIIFVIQLALKDIFPTLFPSLVSHVPMIALLVLFLVIAHHALWLLITAICLIFQDVFLLMAILKVIHLLALLVSLHVPLVHLYYIVLVAKLDLTSEMTTFVMKVVPLDSLLTHLIQFANTAPMTATPAQIRALAFPAIKPLISELSAM